MTKEKVEEIAEEMLSVAIDKKISCSEMKRVLRHHEDKVSKRAGEKIF